MPTFAGLDLAWTRGRPSGVCILAAVGGKVVVEHIGTIAATPTSFARQIALYGETVYAAIDAPLIVSPERRAEALLARRYGRFNAYAFHTSRDWLARNNALAGPQLAEALGARGFVHAINVSAQAPGRYMLEVFPHATHVALFDLDERLAYKRGRLAARRLVMQQYQGHLRQLLAAALPAVADDSRICALLDPASTLVPGRELKALEDTLDAITCAVTAFHAWQHGPVGLETFGAAEHGQIVVPRPV